MRNKTLKHPLRLPPQQSLTYFLPIHPTVPKYNPTNLQPELLECSLIDLKASTLSAAPLSHFLRYKVITCNASLMVSLPVFKVNVFSSSSMKRPNPLTQPTQSCETSCFGLQPRLCSFFPCLYFNHVRLFYFNLLNMLCSFISQTHACSTLCLVHEHQDLLHYSVPVLLWILAQRALFEGNPSLPCQLPGSHMHSTPCIIALKERLIICNYGSFTYLIVSFSLTRL